MTAPGRPKIRAWRTKPALLAAFALLAFLTVAETAASQAGWLADACLGTGGARETRADIDILAHPGPEARESLRVDIRAPDASGTFVRKWFVRGAPWMGWALDLSRLRIEAERMNVSVAPLSAILLRRRSIPVGTSPGELVSYWGFGAGLFLTKLATDFLPAAGAGPERERLTLNLDVRAGLAWRISRSASLFGEYRASLVQVGRSLLPEEIGAPPGSHHVILGFSLVF